MRVFGTSDLLEAISLALSLRIERADERIVKGFDILCVERESEVALAIAEM